MHFPEPMTPLDEWFLRTEFEGVTRVAQLYELPMMGKGRRFNTYAYAAIAPLPPEELAALGQRAQEHLGAAMARLGEQWENEFLPEIQRYLSNWAAFDLACASLAGLVAHLDTMVETRERLWDIHFLVWFPAYTAITLFEELYRDLFGDEHTFDAYRLLQGFKNKTLETTHALWQLSREALSDPVVCQVLEESDPAEVPTTLSRSVEGRSFLTRLQAYLDEYGQRSDKWVISSPSWVEDPTPVISNLQDYITQPDRDLSAETARLAAERERLLAEVRARLVDFPQPVVAHFEFLLKAAQVGSVLTEDHGFWIDFRGWYPVRCTFLEFGRHFAQARILDKPDDIFFLTLDEVRETAQALPAIDRRLLVAGRQAELAYFRGIQPPPALGTMPAGPPAGDPVSRTIGNFFGAPPPTSLDPNLLQGNAGSPGTARGPARVIRSLAESAKLQPGDILVAETTAPPWTPLFASAAAVVTDTGGILSHCAVVAREYGIPAVVGTGTATMMIQDGQTVEVDGQAGTVRIIEPR
jgi:pyruvate,water dikinase